MRVLWFTNVPLAGEDPRLSGSWLGVLADELVGSGDIELCLVSPSSVAGIVRRDRGPVTQWLIPGEWFPPASRRLVPASVRTIRLLVEQFMPDVVNVWGTEYNFGLLTARRLVKGPSVLTMQGLTYRVARSYEGGLLPSEQRAATGLWQLLRRVSISRSKISLAAREAIEREIISGHEWIICQTPWQEAHARDNRPDAEIFRIALPVRRAFEESRGWVPQEGEVRLFCSAPYVTPFKGLHVAVRALRIVRRTHPTATLRIAGPKPGRGFRQDGYLRWLQGQIRVLGLEPTVSWLGPLSANQMADELCSASVAVIPAFVESYCMALAEAMWVGTPTAVAYTGGTSWLGRDEDTCLFFPPGDEVMCAYQILRLLTVPALADAIARNARMTAKTVNDRRMIVETLVSAYRRAIDSFRSGERS